MVSVLQEARRQIMRDRWSNRLNHDAMMSQLQATGLSKTEARIYSDATSQKLAAILTARRDGKIHAAQAIDHLIGIGMILEMARDWLSEKAAGFESNNGIEASAQTHRTHHEGDSSILRKSN